MISRAVRVAPSPLRGRRARRGAALLVALAALVLLMALALALHAVTLRAHRSARRAVLVRAAMDGAEGALTRWQVRLARGEPPEAFPGLDEGGTGAMAVPGAVRELDGTGDDARDGGAGEGGAGAGVVPVRVRVTLVTFAQGVRLLVSEGTARAGGMRARRRVSLVLVPDTLPALPGNPGDTTAGSVRPRLVPAPERPWAELP